MQERAETKDMGEKNMLFFYSFYLLILFNLIYVLMRR